MHRITHVLVPGTFDPITYGHIDVVRRACRMCPKVTVAVAASLGKNGVGTTFSLDERVALAREALADEVGVNVEPFSGLLVDFARDIGAQAVVKGLRAMTDFEYELQQADLNYRLDDSLESIFVMSSPEFGYLSSSVVRQIASFGGDVSEFVPPAVARALARRFDTSAQDGVVD
jgi:pantetheine-phosphate adenylyltransferase